MKRRFLAMLLSLAMVLTMLPVSAFAANVETLTVVATSEGDSNKTVKVKTLQTAPSTDVNATNVYYKFMDKVPDQDPTQITVAANEYTSVALSALRDTGVERVAQPYIAVATLADDADTTNQPVDVTGWGIALIDEPAAISGVSVEDRKIKGITVGSDTYKYKVFAADADIDVITTKTTIVSLAEADGWTAITDGDNVTLPKSAAGTLVVVKAEQNAETVSAIATVEDVEAAAYTALTVTVSNDGKVEVKEGAQGEALATSGFSFYKVASDKENWAGQNWNAATPASTVTTYFGGDSSKLTLSEKTETKDVLTSALNGEKIVAIRTTGEGAAATLDAIGMSAEVTYAPPAAPTELTVTVDAKTNAVTVTKPGASQGADPETVNHTNLLFFKATDKNSWSSENWNTDTDISAVESAWTSNKLELTNDGKLPDTMTTEAYVIAVEKATDKLAGIGETTDKVKYTEPTLEIGEVTVGTTDNVISHDGLSATSGATIKYALADNKFTGPVTAKTVWSTDVVVAANKVTSYDPAADNKIDSTATGKYLIAAVVKDTEGTVVSIACTSIPVSYYDANKKHVTVTNENANDDKITILTPSVEVAGESADQGTATIKVTATAGYQPVVVSVNSTAVAEADAAKYKFTAGSNNEYTLNLTGLSISQDTAIVIKSEAIKYTVTVSTTDSNVTIVSPAANGENKHVATVNSGATTEITVDVTKDYTPASTGLSFTKASEQTGVDSTKERWTATTTAITEDKTYTITASQTSTGNTFTVTVTTTDSNVSIVAPTAGDNGNVATVNSGETTVITVDVKEGFTPTLNGTPALTLKQADGAASGKVRWTVTTGTVTSNLTYEVTATEDQQQPGNTFTVTVSTTDSNVTIVAPAAGDNGNVATVNKDATTEITVDVTEGYTPTLTGSPALTLEKTTGATSGKVRWTVTTEAVTSNLTYTVTATEDQQQPGDTFTVTVSTTDPNVAIVAPEAGDSGNVATVNKDATTEITVDVTEGFTPKLTGTPALTLEKTTGAASGKVRWTATTEAVTSNLTYTVTATEDQQQPGNTTVEGNPDVSDDGTATGEVDTSDIDEVLNNATGTTDQIELDFSTPAGTTKPDDVKKTEIAIPTEAVESINDYNEAAKQDSSKKEVSLSVKTPIGTVTVGSDVVEEMTKESTFTDDKGQTVTPDATTMEAKVVLNVEKVAVPVAPGEDTPTADEKQAFEIHFEKKLVRKGSDTVLATAPVEVKNTTVTITVATTVQPKPGATTLIAAFVDGVKKTVVDWAARYDKGNATFTTPHLSTFVLMAERDSNTPSGIEIVDKNGNAVDLDTISGDTVPIPAGGKLVLPSSITATVTDKVNVTQDASGAWVLADTTKDGTLKFTFEGKTYTATLKAATTTTPTTLTLTREGTIGYGIIKVKISGMTDGKVYLVESAATANNVTVNSYNVITGDSTGEAVIAISRGNVVTVTEHGSELDIANSVPPTATSNAFPAQ